MTAALPSIAPTVAPTAPTSAAPQAAASARQPGFAQMLSRHSQPAEAAPGGEAPVASEVKPSDKPAAPSERGKADKAAKGDKADKLAKSENAARAATSTPEEVRADDASVVQATETMPRDPSLADWLAGLQLPPAVTPSAPPAQSAAPGPELASGEEALQALGKPGAAPQGGAVALGARGAHALQREAAEVDVPKEAASKNGQFAAQVAEAAVAQAMPEAQTTLAQAKPVEELQAHGVQPHAGLSTQAPARPGEAAAPAVVQLPTPATAPEFAQSLGVQVSVLARDGIQHAELHLNPAEMGPISVQIAIDGTQAQVNFGADSAATRHIIESGLPELAASLREAGFTLSGGGVHSQARGREQGGEGEGDARRSSSNAQIETDVTPRRVLVRTSAGGVDLYA